jgi:hypothetical protein
MKKVSLIERGANRVHNRKVIAEHIAPVLGFNPYDRGKVSTAVQNTVLLVDVGRTIGDYYLPDAEPTGAPWYYCVQISDKRLNEPNRVAVYLIPDYYTTLKLLVEKYGVSPNTSVADTGVFKRFARTEGECLGVIPLPIVQ